MVLTRNGIVDDTVKSARLFLVEVRSLTIECLIISARNEISDDTVKVFDHF